MNIMDDPLKGLNHLPMMQSAARPALDRKVSRKLRWSDCVDDSRAPHGYRRRLQNKGCFNSHKKGSK
ncbi:hypothetical protein HNY73_002506 [Argiope bruennichi]|uniref:Uncharacterized protein n=1 Tax=Argiope bruennichi TaxID=94029 RepID=A0A8T0FV10_ARGBR|nr:hypothetical protein HNY73_002506 [Argiope bruennichi]